MVGTIIVAGVFILALLIHFYAFLYLGTVEDGRDRVVNPKYSIYPESPRATELNQITYMMTSTTACLIYSIFATIIIRQILLFIEMSGKLRFLVYAATWAVIFIIAFIIRRINAGKAAKMAAEDGIEFDKRHREELEKKHEEDLKKKHEEEKKIERLNELKQKGLIINEGDLTPEQLYQLANAFYQGTMMNAKDGTMKPDYEKALEYFERAGNQGHLPSQVNAAKMYLNGIGVEQDYEKAANWCVRAAAKGDKDAGAETMYELGITQLNGTNGFAKNEKFAFYFFKKSAEMGYVKAQVALGLLYSEGTGVEKDIEKAAEWFEKAADQGDNMACTNLGMMYLTGNGVQKDIGKAKSLLTRASMNDDPIAMINLGMLNITEGLEEQGLTWLRKAAEHPQGKQLLEAEALRGNKHAQKALDTLK